MADITVTGGEIAQDEINNYVKYLSDKNDGRSLKSLQIAVDGEFVDLTYELEPIPFERIRRITGYLVGTTDRWNNAKRAEERDRVKHGLDCSCCH
ncbi:anaerobic ribonucleoside-triphosphate reductase-like protein [Clostridium sp. KNHs216]|nr:anaerobic ribonucleoside-triphosphate reductase-like protein [Clostridium sp. KNHs216]